MNGFSPSSKIPSIEADKFFTFDENPRVNDVLNLLQKCGHCYGDRHRTWINDQILRILCGSEENYQKWVAAYIQHERPFTDIDDDDPRIVSALDFLWEYGNSENTGDGFAAYYFNQQKAWITDQILRILCGSDDAYTEWVANYEKILSEDHDDHCEWTVGIAIVADAAGSKGSYTWDIGIAPCN